MNGSVEEVHYFNRDLSWLQFNRRVLQEACDENTPLLERAKFLAIVSSNLDEFMSVRVAGIIAQIKAGVSREDFTGLPPGQLLELLLRRTKTLVSDQYRAFEQVMNRLAAEGIGFTSVGDLSTQQRIKMESYFRSKVLPVLTPMAIDQSRPFPLIRSRSLYFAVLLSGEDDSDGNLPYLALLQVPDNLPRLIEVPEPVAERPNSFILLEDLIQAHIRTLFNGYTVVSSQVFRIIRNADIPFDEAGIEDLLHEVEMKVRRRRWGAPVRLEIERGFEITALNTIRRLLQVNGNVVALDGPLDLSFLMRFSNEIRGFDHLRYPEHHPTYPQEFAGTDDFFSVLRERDVLVMHPYESFEAVDDFITQAAKDPSVLAIKMTLYRASGQSHIIRALTRAAENGKQVTVVVELKARFDEERNILWAKKLEKAGCHVVYGLAGLKVHAKMLLVVRQEGNIINRYVHMSTGNYNGKTARLYTDLGWFTCRPEIGEDIAGLFNEITGFSLPNRWHHISTAPNQMLHSLTALIRREMRNAALNKPARIIAKVNSLSHAGMIDQLYEASRAGVKIDLIVRGICCLKPGVEGLSENISVRSIVDRFLEHSRVYYFENGGAPELWLSSADWMTRNLTRRIELMWPVLDEKLERIIIDYLMLLLHDNVKARELLPNGSYEKVNKDPQEPTVRSQFEMHKIVNEKYRLWKSSATRYANVMLDDAMAEAPEVIPLQ